MDELNEIKSERLEAIMTEQNEYFKGRGSSKSQQDSWLIARLCGEIVKMDSDIVKLKNQIR